MIKTIIIEDEINVSQVLQKILKRIAPDCEVVATTGFVGQAVELINRYRPELIFMDIELEDGTGFDVLNQINSDAKIIFTTAYNQYAIKAFKFSAVDYLLKPIDPLELQEAVKRALDIISDTTEYKTLLNVLKDNMDKKEQKIILKTTEQRYVINVADIIRLEADGAYTLFVTQTNNIIVSKNLKYYQDILDVDFTRCHQSHLVNNSHIKSMEKNGQLIMSNGDNVPISTRRKQEIIQLVSKL